MRSIRTSITIVLAGVLASLFPFSAVAMPNFARRYSVPCSLCHNPIPRLTDFGYNFRAAGFRLPEEIGKAEKEPNLTDLFAARLQARYDYNRVDNAGAKSTRNQLTFAEVTLYPASGAFFKNYSSLFELSQAPEETPEIENAYLRGNWNHGPGFVSVRGGIFHPFEGYGASDRPILIDRPFIQRIPAKFNQSTYFTPWGFDQAGVEGGYTVKNTSIRAAIFNGNEFSEEEGHAIPAAGGKTPGRPAFNSKDFQLFFNQILTGDGGGVSLYYYKGNIALPVEETFFKDSFDRWALYGSYPVVKKILLLGGYQQGKDDTFTAAGGLGPKSTSKGYFAEADFVPSSDLGLVARYDSFDRSNRVSKNKVSGITLGANK